MSQHRNQRSLRPRSTWLRIVCLGHAERDATSVTIRTRHVGLSRGAVTSVAQRCNATDRSSSGTPWATAATRWPHDVDTSGW